MSTLELNRIRKPAKGLIELAPLLLQAEAGRYAVGAFNYCNMESAQAIVEEACVQRSPVVLLTGPWELPLLGTRAIVQIASLVAAEADVPVCLHLDHATEIEMVRECLEAGFPSVMIDASQHCFEDNINMTREVVRMAHAVGATVEAELGAVGRVDDSTLEGAGSEVELTDPSRAAEFVERTGVDVLAVAIGNAHGIYTQRPQLDFERLEAIRKTVDVPLVLHGGSGTPVDQLKRAIDTGISKVNVASEISRSYLNSIEAANAAADGKAWYAKALVDAKSSVREVVERWMLVLGSSGQVK